MRVKFFAVLLIAVVASGCAYTNAGDANQLSDLADKQDSSNYHVLYDFEVEAASLVRRGTGEAESYGINGETRFDRFYEYVGGTSRTSVYSMNGSGSVQCRKSYSKANNSTTTSCNYTETTADRYIDTSRYVNENYSINYIEDRSYANRTCEFYRIGLPPSDFEDSSYIRGGALVDLCIDKEKGYIAYNSMNLSVPVQVTGQTIENLYTLKAKRFNEEVDSSDVRPPENVNISS